MALPRCLLLLLSLQAALAWSLVGAKKDQTIEEQLIVSVLAQGGKLVRLLLPRGSPSLQPLQIRAWHPRLRARRRGSPQLNCPRPPPLPPPALVTPAGRLCHRAGLPHLHARGGGQQGLEA